MVSVAAVGSVTSTDNQTVAASAPSGVVAGSLLLLFCSVRHSGGESPGTPSGWTLAGSTEPSSARAYCWYRYADGTTTDTPTIDLGANASQGLQLVMLRLTGAADSSPIDSTNGGSGTSASALAIPTSSVTADGSLATTLFTINTGGSAVTNSWPGSWTEHVDNWPDSVIRHTMTLGSLGVDSGTSTGGNVTPSAASTYAALTVIVKPAAGPSVSIPAIYSTLTRGL